MKPRVLVVDDDAHIREIFADVLAAEGCEVLTAADGYAALDPVTAERLAVILVDVRMPGMDGIEFCRRFSERPGPRAPVVLLTAASDPSVLTEGIHVAGVLSKPFSLDELVETIRRHARCSA